MFPAQGIRFFEVTGHYKDRRYGLRKALGSPFNFISPILTINYCPETASVLLSCGVVFFSESVFCYSGGH
jgi:hypothetical protein